MVGFQHPIRIFCMRDCLAVPFDLQMAGCFLEQRWTRKILDIEFRFWWHFACSFLVTKEI